MAIKRIKKSCFTGRSSEQERLVIIFFQTVDSSFPDLTRKFKIKVLCLFGPVISSLICCHN